MTLNELNHYSLGACMLQEKAFQTNQRALDLMDDVSMYI